MKRAREMAESAASQAQSAAGAVTQRAQDPETQERLSQQARSAMGAARRGVSTVVERIDPSTLAELIVKATALQEMTNRALREKGSPYRISEVSISASIPPGVTFAIGRIDGAEEAVVGEIHSSEELVADDQHQGEVVVALDGAMIDDATADAIAEAAAVPGAMPPSSVSRT